MTKYKNQIKGSLNCKSLVNLFLKNRKIYFQAITLSIILLNLFFIFFTSCKSEKHSLNDLSNLSVKIIDSINTISPIVTCQVVNNKGKYFAYVAGEGNELESFAVDENGKFKPMKNYTLTSQFGGLRGIMETSISGSKILLIGNKAHNSVEQYAVNDSGHLQLLSDFTDTDSTFIKGNITTEIIETGEKKYVFVGGLDTGLSCFEITADNQFRHIQSIEDDSTTFLNGIIGMTHMNIDGRVFLFAGSFMDDGVSSFEIFEDGHFKNLQNIRDDENLFLTGAFPLNSIQLGNRNFLLVGHRHKYHYPVYKDEDIVYHGDGINLFEIDGQGKMNLKTTVKDSEELNLKGSTRIELLKINEETALVFVATRDDNGVQVLSLNAEGEIIPIYQFDCNFSIYNGMTIEKINDKWYLFVGGYDKHILMSYLIKM